MSEDLSDTSHRRRGYRDEGGSGNEKEKTGVNAEGSKHLCMHEARKCKIISSHGDVISLTGTPTMSSIRVWKGPRRCSTMIGRVSIFPGRDGHSQGFPRRQIGGCDMELSQEELVR